MGENRRAAMIVVLAEAGAGLVERVHHAVGDGGGHRWQKPGRAVLAEKVTHGTPLELLRGANRRSGNLDRVEGLGCVLSRELRSPRLSRGEVAGANAGASTDYTGVPGTGARVSVT